MQSNLVALHLSCMGDAEDDQDIDSLLDEHFTGIFKEARASPGYKTQGLRDPANPLKLRADMGRLSLWEISCPSMGDGRSS